MKTTLPSFYPDTAAARDEWVLSRRPQRNALDPWRPWAFFVEDEPCAMNPVPCTLSPGSDGLSRVPVATIFLTNRECPWRCLMCDLWKNTLT